MYIYRYIYTSGYLHVYVVCGAPVSLLTPTCRPKKVLSIYYGPQNGTMPLHGPPEVTTTLASSTLTRITLLPRGCCGIRSSVRNRSMLVWVPGMRSLAKVMFEVPSMTICWKVIELCYLSRQPPSGIDRIESCTSQKYNPKPCCPISQSRCRTEGPDAEPFSKPWPFSTGLALYPL